MPQLFHLLYYLILWIPQALKNTNMCSTDDFIECGLCGQVNKSANCHVFEEFYLCYQLVVLGEWRVWDAEDCWVYDSHLSEFFQVVESVFSKGIVW